MPGKDNLPYLFKPLIKPHQRTNHYGCYAYAVEYGAEVIHEKSLNKTHMTKIL